MEKRFTKTGPTSSKLFMNDFSPEFSYEHQYTSGAAFGPASERAKNAIREHDRQIMSEIQRTGGFESYVDEHPEVLTAFTDRKPFLCCMDERTSEGTIHVPGSGIGIEGEEEKNGFKERLQAAGVEGVYSHEGCGAFKLYAEKNGIANTRESAEAHTKKLAEDLGIEYKGFLKTSGEHPGGAVYYDTTGRLDSGSLIWQKNMPTGFTISRSFLSPTEAKAAMVLAVKIAFGEKGHGHESFSEKHPLTLVGISDAFHKTITEDFTQEFIRRELETCYEEIVAAIPEARGKIFIDGLALPEKIEGEERVAA